MERSGVDALTRSECMELLDQARVGRVGVSIDALPAILPVNFTLLDESILFCTVPGTSLARAVAASVVAFQVDSYDPAGSTGWSVLAVGRANEITEPTTLDRARSIPLDAWALSTGADRFVCLETTRLSGRRHYRQ